MWLLSYRNWYFWTKLISFSKLKDEQAIIIQIWQLNYEKLLPSIVSVIQEHPSLGNRIRIQCSRRILFSADNSFRPHHNAPHRFRCFRKLPFKIDYKKMSAMWCTAPHRCGLAFSLPWCIHRAIFSMTEAKLTYFIYFYWIWWNDLIEGLFHYWKEIYSNVILFILIALLSWKACFIVFIVR